MLAPTCHIFQQTPETLSLWCVEHGMKHYRADQVLHWVYRRRVIDPGQMTNLSMADRAVLGESMTFLSGGILRHQVATDGTQKLLIQWDDPCASTTLPVLPTHPSGLKPQASLQTESVLIPTAERNTACISSQVGCPVGCRFCASGIGGLDGNLPAGRIVEQVWRLGALPGVERITNVVFMGMGEPLANFAAVIGAVRLLNAEWGLGIGARKITISTVGLPRAIERLAEELEQPVTLALSLHAPNDVLRRQLIPWAQYTTIDELLRACAAWFDRTGREITLEYILLGGVNDGPGHARELAELARTLRANVNLMRYNEVAGLPFARPTDRAVDEFQGILRANRVNAFVRASRGAEIAAACGQLRHEARAPADATPSV